METIGKIRRWHRVDKLSISKIARRRCDIIETGNDSYRLKKRNQPAPAKRKSKEKNLTPNP